MTDDKIDWNDEEDDGFWDNLSEDMEEEGYNSKTGEYHWTEMSYYRYAGYNWTHDFLYKEIEEDEDE